MQRKARRKTERAYSEAAEEERIKRIKVAMEKSIASYDAELDEDEPWTRPGISALTRGERIASNTDPD